MNRAFHIFIGGVSALLIGLFLVLLLSMLVELWHQSSVRPPQVSEILFAARLSLLTATIASVIALAVSIPVGVAPITAEGRHRQDLEQGLLQQAPPGEGRRAGRGSGAPGVHAVGGDDPEARVLRFL